MAVGESDATAGIDGSGNETTEYVMSDRIVLGPIDTDVRIDDPSKLTKVEDAADAVLAANGWSRTGQWEATDNARFAAVERI